MNDSKKFKEKPLKMLVSKNKMLTKRRSSKRFKDRLTLK